jgi:hypothetical protein
MGVAAYVGEVIATHTVRWWPAVCPCRCTRPVACGREQTLRPRSRLQDAPGLNECFPQIFIGDTAPLDVAELHPE